MARSIVNVLNTGRTKGVEHVGEPVTGLEVLGNTNRTGTKVTFKPDIRVFQNGIQLNYDTLAERLQELLS